jgi:hypothetical protein
LQKDRLRAQELRAQEKRRAEDAGAGSSTQPKDVVKDAATRLFADEARKYHKSKAAAKSYETVPNGAGGRKSSSETSSFAALNEGHEIPFEERETEVEDNADETPRKKNAKGKKKKKTSPRNSNDSPVLNLLIVKPKSYLSKTIFFVIPSKTIFCYSF